MNLSTSVVFDNLYSCSLCFRQPPYVVRARKSLPRRLVEPSSPRRKCVRLMSASCRASPSESQTEPNSNSEKEDVLGGGESTSLVNVEEDNGATNTQPIVVANVEEDNKTADAEPSVLIENQPSEIMDSNNLSEEFIEASESQMNLQGSNENMEVATGSPLPGMKLGETVRIPKATIDILRDQVFGFDTFFVTSQEPYEGGVLFKGNLRGKPANSYEKILKRMQDKFGDEYRLFLLINPEDDKPVAVVVPTKSLQPESTAVPEWFAAGAFGLVTIFTLLLRNVPALQSNLLSAFDNLGLLNDGISGALATTLVLGVHEISHILVAKSVGLKLGIPYFVPSWQIGSFGAITRILNIVPNREALLKFAAAGPMGGFLAGFILLILGFILPPSDGVGIIIDPIVFHESFLVGGIAKLILGYTLKEGTKIAINPLVLWAWAGLLINAINSIPAGELDGGRISFALWGRKISARITGASIVLLAVSSLFNDVAFYWVVLIFFLQRGPVAPLSEEITDPENKYIALGVAVLLFGLLVCLPYPFPFAMVLESSSF